MGCCHNVETTSTIMYIKNDSSITNIENLPHKNWKTQIKLNATPVIFSQNEIYRNRPILLKLIANKQRKIHFYL